MQRYSAKRADAGTTPPPRTPRSGTRSNGLPPSDDPSLSMLLRASAPQTGTASVPPLPSRRPAPPPAPPPPPRRHSPQPFSAPISKPASGFPPADLSPSLPDPEALRESLEDIAHEIVHETGEQVRADLGKLSERGKVLYTMAIRFCDMAKGSSDNAASSLKKTREISDLIQRNILRGEALVNEIQDTKKTFQADTAEINGQMEAFKETLAELAKLRAIRFKESTAILVNAGARFLKWATLLVIAMGVVRLGTNHFGDALHLFDSSSKPAREPLAEIKSPTADLPPPLPPGSANVAAPDLPSKPAQVTKKSSAPHPVSAPPEPNPDEGVIESVPNASTMADSLGKKEKGCIYPKMTETVAGSPGAYTWTGGKSWICTEKRPPQKMQFQSIELRQAYCGCHETPTGN